jgi:hypothetical protein
MTLPPSGRIKKTAGLPVVIALGIRVTGWKRWISLPLMCRLYIRRGDRVKYQVPFRTKLKPALEGVS